MTFLDAEIIVLNSGVIDWRWENPRAIELLKGYIYRHEYSEVSDDVLRDFITNELGECPSVYSL